MAELFLEGGRSEGIVAELFLEGGRSEGILSQLQGIRNTCPTWRSLTFFTPFNRLIAVAVVP